MRVAYLFSYFGHNSRTAGPISTGQKRDDSGRRDASFGVSGSPLGRPLRILKRGGGARPVQTTAPTRLTSGPPHPERSRGFESIGEGPRKPLDRVPSRSVEGFGPRGPPSHRRTLSDAAPERPGRSAPFKAGDLEEGRAFPWDRAATRYGTNGAPSGPIPRYFGAPGR